MDLPRVTVPFCALYKDTQSNCVRTVDLPATGLPMDVLDGEIRTWLGMKTGQRLALSTRSMAHQFNWVEMQTTKLFPGLRTCLSKAAKTATYGLWNFWNVVHRRILVPALNDPALFGRNSIEPYLSLQYPCETRENRLVRVFETGSDISTYHFMCGITNACFGMRQWAVRSRDHTLELLIRQRHYYDNCLRDYIYALCRERFMRMFEACAIETAYHMLFPAPRRLLGTTRYCAVSKGISDWVGPSNQDSGNPTDYVIVASDERSYVIFLVAIRHFVQKTDVCAREGVECNREEEAVLRAYEHVIDAGVISMIRQPFTGECDRQPMEMLLPLYQPGPLSRPPRFDEDAAPSFEYIDRQCALQSHMAEIGNQAFVVLVASLRQLFRAYMTLAERETHLNGLEALEQYLKSRGWSFSNL